MPSQLTEPGGTASIEVTVTNTGDAAAILTALSDDVNPDLDGVGTCATGGQVAIGGTYQCAYDVAFSGVGGVVLDTVVSATLTDDVDASVASGSFTASVLITDAAASGAISLGVAPASVAEPGATVTYTVRVDNTGPLDPLIVTSLIHDIAGEVNGLGDCSLSQEISPGGFYECSFPADVSGNAGEVVSTVVVGSGNDSDGSPWSATSDAADVTITDTPSAMSVTKVADPLELDEPGGDVSFTLTVNNDSTADGITIDALDDDVYGDLNGLGDCSVPQSIAAGDSYSCTFTGAVSGNAGEVLTDTITVDATDDDGNPLSEQASANVTILDTPSSMSVEKTAAPTELDEPGGDVTFTVVVDNTSAADAITLDGLVDDIHGDLDGLGDCSVPQSIAAGDSYSCSFTVPVNGNAGEVETDTVTAEATDDDGNPLSEQDDAEVVIVDVPSSMTLTKDAGVSEVNEPGANVTFTISIENTSPVDEITIDTLSDDLFGDITQVQGDVVATDCAVTQTLAPGETYDCTFTAFVSGNAGETHTDTVTGSGEDDDGTPVSADGSAEVDIIDVPPTMEISKTAVPTELPEPGGDVTFTFSVTNTSPEPITITSIGDDVYGNQNAACGLPAVVAPGATFTCDITGAVLGDSGDLRSDIVTIQAQDDDGNSITEQAEATVTITDLLPSIEVEKSVQPETLPEPGGTVQIRVEVTNTSGEDVVITELVDSIHGDLNGQGTCQTPTTTVASGGTYVCSFSVTVTGEAGYQEIDVITATGEDNEGNVTTADDDATVTIVDVLPSMNVDKTTDPGSLPEPGGSYDIVVTITNTSTVDDLEITSIIDDPHGDLNGQGDCVVPQTIPPGGQYSCRVPEELLGNAGDSESDTVTVTGEDNEGNEITDDDGATFTLTDIVPSIDVDKTASPTTVPEPGGDVTFTITVTNESLEQVSQMTLDDDVYGDLNGLGTCATPVVLEPAGQPNDSYSCEFTVFITNDAGESQIDIVTATGVDDEGNVVEGTDSETVTVVDVPPEFTVTKTANPTELPEPGGSVFYTFVIENTGDEPVTITEIVDDPYGDLDGVFGCSVPQTIQPGDTYTCSVQQDATGNAGDVISDEVTVTGEDNDGNSITESDDAEVTITDVPPALAVDKSPNPGSVPITGGNVTFEVTVDNLSTFEELTLTSLNDAPYGNVADASNPNLVSTTCVVPQVIAPLESYSCEFTAFVPWTPGGSTDTLTATGEDDDGSTTTDSDDAVVRPRPPIFGDFEVSKTASPTALPEPGGTFSYTVTVEPTSTYPILILGLQDDPYGNIADLANPNLVSTDCVVPALAVPGIPFSCTFEVEILDEPGSFADEVTVTTPFGDLADDAVVTITDVEPEASISKTASPNPVPEPGGVVTYTVSVSNDSLVEAIELTSLVDDVHGNITDPANPSIVATTCSVSQTIGIGDSYTCTFDAEHFGNVGETQTDFVFGSVTDNEGNVLDIVDSETIGFADALPDFSVTKTPNPSTVPEPGGTVNYTVVITNNAPEPVQITSLVDDQDGDVLDLDGQGSCLVSQTIPPGGTYVCSFPRAVSGNAGDIVPDTVTATGQDDDGNSADRTADAEVEIIPADPVLNVTKSASPASVPEPGGDVVYTVTITNASVATDPVTIDSLTDSVEGGPATTPPDLACTGPSGAVSPPFVLQPGEAATCTFAGTVSGDAGDSLSDTFTASGTDDEGTPASGSGSETVPVTDVDPTMTVVKSADPNPIPEPGGPVDFTVAVTNTSDESIFITNIFDDVAGPLTPGTCVLPPSGEVLPGETYECTWRGSVFGDAGDVRSNIVTVTVNDNEGNVIEVSDMEDTVIADVLPEFEITKTANPTSLPEPGGNVTFTVTFTNNSIEPVTVDSAVDDVYGPLSGLGTCNVLGALRITIVPGDTFLCTFTAPVTGTAEASPYTDTITASVSDNDGNSVEEEASADVELTDVVPEITVVKDVSPATLPEPGGEFTFSVSVTNDSDFESVELTTLDDDIYGDIADAGNPDIVSTTCAVPQTLAPGETYDCEFVGVFTGTAFDSQTDVVTGTAEDDEGNEVTDDDDATVELTDVLPEISATKVPDPASLPEPGGDVTFTVTVFNDSPVDDVVLTSLDDDVYGDLTSTAGDIVSTTCVLPQTIVLGESYTCEFTAPVTGTAELSPYTDTITATANDDDGNTVEAEASADVELTDVLPAISVDKSADPLTEPEPEGTFTFTIVVTNDSVEPVELTDLDDDVYGDITQVQGDITATTCSVPQTIALGADYTCTFTGTFSGDAGDTQTDVVTATAEDDEGNPASAQDDAVVELTDVLPAITVDKSAAPLTQPEPVGTFIFTVVITNDSVESVELTDLDDDIYGDITQVQGDISATTCAVPQTIAVGGDYSCSFDATFTGNAGDTQTDVVTATANDNDGNVATDDDDAIVELTDVLPTIAVDKEAPVDQLPEPGGTFTFEVEVVNTSEEPLTLESLSDDIYGDITQVQGLITATTCSVPQALAVGGSYSCSFDATFTGNAGDSQTDVVTATATDDEDNVATDDDDATVELTDLPSSIEVTKVVDPVGVDEPGADVVYTITVVNTSVADTVTIDTLDDDIYGDITQVQGDIIATTCAVPFDLAPSGQAGDSYTCSFTAAVSGNAGDVVTDVVTASGLDDDDVPVEDDDDASVTILDVLPVITVDKTADPLSTPEPGGEFTFSVVVSNDSVEEVTLTSLTDDIYGDITQVQGDITSTTCATGGTIAVGGTYECEFTALFEGNAFDSQTDTVTATAEDDEANTAEAEDDATVELTDVPSSIEVTKDADPTQVEEPGADVVFSVSIENTSDPDVVTIESITDDIFGDVTQVQGDVSATDCAVPFDLAPAETYDCTFTAFVSGNAGDIVTDTVTGTGTDDDGFEVTDNDTADVEIVDVLPSIGLDKSADPLALDEPGGEFTFTFVVTNEAVEPLQVISLIDDVYGDVTVVGGAITATDCVVPTTIAVGGTYTCSFTGIFTGNAGDSQTDVVLVSAQDDEGNPVEAEDDAIVELLPVPPVISTTKTPNPTEVVEPGGDVTFTVTVTNESTFEPVTLDALDDSVFGDLDGQGNCLADGSITLQPGETYTCRFVGEVTGAAGTTHRNTVTATASDDDPVPAVVTASAAAEVRIVALQIEGLAETNMLPASDVGDRLHSTTGDLVRMWVLFLAAAILVGGLGLAVVRRARI